MEWIDVWQGNLHLVYTQAAALICVKSLEGSLIGSFLLKAIQADSSCDELLVIDSTCITASGSATIVEIEQAPLL